MVEGRTQLSRTMRIDLIPDVPTEPVKGKSRRIVFAARGRKARPAGLRGGDVAAKSGYEELLQSIYDGVLIADLSGRIVDVNARVLDFVQYERSELCGLDITEVISGADGTLVDTLSRNLDHERYTLIQAHCVRKDGSFFPAEIAVNRLNLGAMHLCFFVRDITIRRQAEEMLRTEHNAIQNSGSGIAVADLDARLEYVNPAVEQMWRCTEEGALLGEDVRDCFADRDTAGTMVLTVLEQHGAWSGEIRAKRMDGTEFDVQVNAACNRNSDGEIVGIVFSFVDTEDRKRAEQAVREAERQRVMLESLGAACHHLGQPATVLLANLEIVQQELRQAGPEVRQLIAKSIDAVEDMGRILHKLNAVHEYKTTRYLAKTEGKDDEEGRIIEI